MPSVTLKLAIGNFSVEVSGPSVYAEKKLEELISKYLTASIKPSIADSSPSGSSPIQALQTPGGKKRSAAEFLKLTSHPNQTDRALLLGYYLEKVDSQASFTTAELRDLGRAAKYAFTNISDNVARLVGRGLMMSAGEKEGQRAYALTATGEEYAESLVSQP